METEDIGLQLVAHQTALHTWLSVNDRENRIHMQFSLMNKGLCQNQQVNLCILDIINIFFSFCIQFCMLSFLNKELVAPMNPAVSRRSPWEPLSLLFLSGPYLSSKVSNVRSGVFWHMHRAGDVHLVCSIQFVA